MEEWAVTAIHTRTGETRIIQVDANDAIESFGQAERDALMRLACDCGAEVDPVTREIPPGAHIPPCPEASPALQLAQQAAALARKHITDALDALQSLTAMAGITTDSSYGPAGPDSSTNRAQFLRDHHIAAMTSLGEALRALRAQQLCRALAELK